MILEGGKQGMFNNSPYGLLKLIQYDSGARKTRKLEYCPSGAKEQGILRHRIAASYDIRWQVQYSRGK